MTKQGLVYLLGVVIFGLTYYPVRQAIGNDLLFVVAALVYLAALRIIGLLWERASGGKALRKP